MHAWERIFGSALLFLLLGSGVVYSQTAELLTAVNGESPLTLASAADLLGIVGGSLPVVFEPGGAPEALRKIGYSIPRKRATDAISVGNFCYLTMQLLDLRGGLLYSIFPGPRYAVREIENREILPAGTDPGTPISGREALRILGMITRARR